MKHKTDKIQCKNSAVKILKLNTYSIFNQNFQNFVKENTENRDFVKKREKNLVDLEKFDVALNFSLKKVTINK